MLREGVACFFLSFFPFFWGVGRGGEGGGEETLILGKALCMLDPVEE